MEMKELLDSTKILRRFGLCLDTSVVLFEDSMCPAKMTFGALKIVRAPIERLLSALGSAISGSPDEGVGEYPFLFLTVQACTFNRV
jgi:hypothetical protein